VDQRHELDLGGALILVALVGQKFCDVLVAPLRELPLFGWGMLPGEKGLAPDVVVKEPGLAGE
jgi:hypothetical protein